MNSISGAVLVLTVACSTLLMGCSSTSAAFPYSQQQKYLVDSWINRFYEIRNVSPRVIPSEMATSDEQIVKYLKTTFPNFDFGRIYEYRGFLVVYLNFDMPDHMESNDGLNVILVELKSRQFKPFVPAKG
jgi:hypothetical protein